MTMKVEYRVRPITRYVVTRFHKSDSEADGFAGGCETRGEYDNGEVAYQVAYALCKADHSASGEPEDSVNFIYPDMPDNVEASLS